MASTPSVSQSTVTSSDRFMGRVKWFNNKAGYGFITVTDGHKSGSDIFVHHSSIKVDAQQYKYLVQGEYVEFALSAVSSGDHECQSSDVSGIKGGKLMCETRRDFKLARTVYKSTKDPEEVSEPRQQRAPTEHNADSQRVRQPRARGEGPRETSQKAEDKEWTLAKTSRNAAKKPRSKKITEESK